MQESDNPQPLDRRKFHVIDGDGGHPVSRKFEDATAGDAPDVSAPFEAFVWKSRVYGGVLLNVQSIDRPFLEARLPSIIAGVQGRGKAEIFGNKLAVQFGLTDAEVEDGELLDQYRDALLSYLGLTFEAVLIQRIAEPVVDLEVVDEVENSLRKMGLRAIRE